MESNSTDHARLMARRQLSRVLILLAFLDTSVLVLVVGLSLAWSRFHIPTPYFLGLVLGGVAAILAARVALGVRLRRRSGNL
ncbi:MAG: hypothetical protein WA688_10080 [Thermoplasmata archaeon]